MTTKRIYSVLAVIFLASLVAATFFHYFPAGAIGELAALPAVGALFYALFQLGRDSIAHERAVRLEEAKNSFTVGATSHMANVAFDKHVLFCEEYTSGMLFTLTTLFQEGPTRKALDHAKSLVGIRDKWTLWLTPEIETQLGRFEAALRKIGVYERYVSDYPGGKDREPRLKEMFSLFMDVVGEKEWEGETLTGETAVRTMIAALRSVLGIDELTHLRSALVKRALSEIGQSGR
jgi:hypothetical protein